MNDLLNFDDFDSTPKSLIPPSKDGVFWHECTEDGCTTRVEFDDEPWCFTHSPDSGSNRPGYSAYEEAKKNG